MKAKEELNALKKEVEALNKKLAELTEEELAQITGGFDPAAREKRGLEPREDPGIVLKPFVPEDPGIVLKPFVPEDPGI